MTMNCELCTVDGGELILKTDKLRVVLIDDANYPGFCRVIWNEHVKEMTDLVIADRSTMMQAVCKVEQAIRDVMQPHKINLASLGNMVPHLHWHVIPRYQDDAHFPNPVWAATDRVSAELEAKRALLPALREVLRREFSA
ncbi:HIT family protein [Undibacterium flavidum]|uniref:HIT family protein n=1 Tax=Undibacterium flavidum TaxID=2762297 RepID=A0ABR6YBZ2_9BURK|nr:HIT family protein [Undibacterium flavidum]MBC3873849.1 HIT family protein [Undibacterium flavidum]